MMNVAALCKMVTSHREDISLSPLKKKVSAQDIVKPDKECFGLTPS